MTYINGLTRRRPSNGTAGARMVHHRIPTAHIATAVPREAYAHLRPHPVGLTQHRYWTAWAGKRSASGPVPAAPANCR